MFASVTPPNSKKFTQDKFILLNSSNYSYQLEAVDANPENAVIYVIRKACSFSKLKFVPSPIVYLFQPDIIHDFLEGIIPAILIVLLKKLMREKLLKLAQLKYEVKHFLYGVNDGASKPHPYQSTHRVFQALPQRSGPSLGYCYR